MGGGGRGGVPCVLDGRDPANRSSVAGNEQLHSYYYPLAEKGPSERLIHLTQPLKDKSGSLLGEEN